jgi:hypothetical protein
MRIDRENSINVNSEYDVVRLNNIVNELKTEMNFQDFSFIDLGEEMISKLGRGSTIKKPISELSEDLQNEINWLKTLQ